MRKSLLRRSANRALHLLARYGPGATTIRPLLHRLRGAKIGREVFIGDDVYLENEYPEAVEIANGVEIGVRAIILAHTKGAGRIVIEKDAFIGASAIVATSGNRTLRIGEGAVIGAGAVVTTDVSAGMFVAHETAKAIALVRTPFPKAKRMEDFIRGLSPIARPRPERRVGALHDVPLSRPDK
jgi:acetyltransferase-like isoleucine patch superfamily enzyme